MGGIKAKEVMFVFEDDYNKMPEDENLVPFVMNTVEDSINANRETKVDNIIGGDIDSGGETYETYTDVSGNLKTPLYYDQIGLFLKALMGEPETEEVANKKGFYRHTFKSSNPCQPSFMIQDTLQATCRKDGTQKEIYKQFTGLKASTMSITASPDSDYNVEISTLGALADDSLINENLKEISNKNAFKFEAKRIYNKHAKLWFGDMSEENYMVIAKELSFTIDKGVESERVLSAGAIVDETKFDLNGSLNCVFDGETYKKAMSGLPQECKLRFEDESGNVLEFYMKQTQVNFKDEARSYGTKYPLNMDFNAFKSGDNPAKLIVTLVNKIPSYKKIIAQEPPVEEVSKWQPESDENIIHTYKTQDEPVVDETYTDKANKILYFYESEQAYTSPKQGDIREKYCFDDSGVCSLEATQEFNEVLKNYENQ